MMCVLLVCFSLLLSRLPKTAHFLTAHGSVLICVVFNFFSFWLVVACVAKCIDLTKLAHLLIEVVVLCLKRKCICTVHAWFLLLYLLTPIRI